MTVPPPAASSLTPVARKTNVLAIVSLVISILGFNVIAVILGIIALTQVKRSGEGGRGLAIAGIIIGAISIVVYIILIIVFAVVAAANSTITY
jgi:peptidyl-prolyl cis-trans isomerase B (cyclophilin B)